VKESTRSKLETAIKECALHAEILVEALDEHGESKYSASTLESLNKSRLRLLDQMAYRFTKLQATLGEQVLPMLLDVAEEPLADDAPFAQKLQRLISSFEAPLNWCNSGSMLPATASN
jgi:hypothetical protein